MILASIVASAAAFAPVQEGRTSSAIAANPLADEVGAMAPVSRSRRLRRMNYYDRHRVFGVLANNVSHTIVIVLIITILFRFTARILRSPQPLRRWQQGKVRPPPRVRAHPRTCFHACRRRILDDRRRNPIPRSR